VSDGTGLAEKMLGMTKTATVSLHGNTFEVDAVLVGRRVECVFDPFDLTTINIRYQGRPMGAGVARVIGRHTRHPMARPDTAPVPAATGIDYLALLAGRHAAELAERSAPNRFADLADTTDPESETP